MQWHRHEMATSACVTGNRATVTRIVSDYKSIQTLLISKFLLQFACQQLSSIVSRESGESSSLHLCSTQPLPFRSQAVVISVLAVLLVSTALSNNCLVDLFCQAKYQMYSSSGQFGKDKSAKTSVSFEASAVHCMMASSSESVAIDKQVEQTNVHMRSLLALNPTESCFGHCTCPAAGLTLPVLQ